MILGKLFFLLSSLLLLVFIEACDLALHEGHTLRLDNREGPVIFV